MELSNWVATKNGNIVEIIETPDGPYGRCLMGFNNCDLVWSITLSLKGYRI